MTEALNHYLDQRDEDYERQGEEEEVSRLIDDQRRYNSDLIAELSDEIATRQRQTDELNNIIHHLEEEKATLKRDYCELVLAVGNKHEGETRHETALRYIFEAEKGSIEAMEND